nr:acyl-CoA Delta(11) desaturase [Helicoverpa armigera]
MPPFEKSDVLTTDIKEHVSMDEPTIAAPWKHEYIIQNIVFFLYCYIAGIYGVYMCFTTAKWWSVVYMFVVFVTGTIGIIAGAHRLWAHKAFKVKKPLEIFLMLCHCLAYQRTLVTWVRDHRLHHKYSDTDADPHNSSRGFFFSHIGWLLVKNHPEVEKRKGLVDMSDVYANPVLMYQKRNAKWLLPLISFGVPVGVHYILGESFSVCWHLNILRYMLDSNLTFLTNSLAHSWGYRPYDKTMVACQNFPLLLATMGDGFHNFHHAFPWDYRGAELGNGCINHVTKFIDFCASKGWAYDLKVASESVIRNRMKRTGDGTDLWGKKLVEF